MQIKEFFHQVEANGWDWAAGEYESRKGYFVRNLSSSVYTEKGLQPPCVHYSEQAIKDNDWPLLKRQMPDLTYVTRVVGYYSRINNWNLSKLGELKDRRIGDYAVEKRD